MFFKTTTKGQYITMFVLYTNAKIETHNKCVFEKTHGETFTFQAHDIHFDTCLFYFQLSTNPNQIASFHYEFVLKINVNRIICEKLCNIKWFHQWCRLNLSRLHKKSSKTINMDKIS
jgi:hypothetical protein